MTNLSMFEVKHWFRFRALIPKGEHSSRGPAVVLVALKTQGMVVVLRGNGGRAVPARGILRSALRLADAAAPTRR